ncbi:hypothetical protein B0H19DRAFT_1153250, partial [Mycena capillaripes]
RRGDPDAVLAAGSEPTLGDVGAKPRGAVARMLCCCCACCRCCWASWMDEGPELVRCGATWAAAACAAFAGLRGVYGCECDMESECAWRGTGAGRAGGVPAGTRIPRRRRGRHRRARIASILHRSRGPLLLLCLFAVAAPQALLHLLRRQSNPKLARRQRPTCCLVKREPRGTTRKEKEGNVTPAPDEPSPSRTRRRKETETKTKRTSCPPTSPTASSRACRQTICKQTKKCASAWSQRPDCQEGSKIRDRTVRGSESETKYAHGAAKRRRKSNTKPWKIEKQ